MSNRTITVVAYADSHFSRQLGEPFRLLVNPESYRHTKTAADATDPRKADAEESLTFDFILDGRGADSAIDEVERGITRFTAVANSFDGTLHQPNKLLLRDDHGLAFRCVLSRLDVNYTLFRPDGRPLRASVTAAFTSSRAAAPSEVVQREPGAGSSRRP